MGFDTGKRKVARGAPIYEWPDFVGEHALGGKELPSLEERYGLTDQDEVFYTSNGHGPICGTCGHWEASYERVVGLSSGRMGCKCCAESAADWPTDDEDRKLGTRARIRAEQRTQPIGMPRKRRSKKVSSDD